MGITVSIKRLCNSTLNFEKEKRHWWKNIKLVILILVLAGGTKLLIQKIDPVKGRITRYFKENLPIEKTYIPVSFTSKYMKVSNHINIRSLQIFKGSRLKVVNHKFRLNDSLYISDVYFNSKDSIVWASKPLKYDGIFEAKN